MNEKKMEQRRAVRVLMIWRINGAAIETRCEIHHPYPAEDIAKTTVASARYFRRA
jgi:hypothetical protein